MLFPSKAGAFTGSPNSLTISMNLSITSLPISLCPNSLPLKRSSTFTLSPFLRNLIALFALVFKSFDSIPGLNLIYLTAIVFCFFLASFSFLACSYLYLP